MTRPWDAFVGNQNVDVGMNAACGDDQLWRIASHREPGLQDSRIVHGGRQPNEATRRRPLCQRRQAEIEQITALVRRDGVDFIDDYAFQIGEEFCGMLGSDEQRQLLGRGQQNVGRGFALSLAFVRWRIAGASLDLDIEAHFLNRCHQIARHIDGERLERRDSPTARSGWRENQRASYRRRSAR